MFTDMVVFSVMAQRNEALALDGLEKQRRLVRATLLAAPQVAALRDADGRL